MGVFEPYRAIGYITAGVPFSVQRLGTETFVTVSVGKAFQVYNCAKLTLILVSPQLPSKIRALASFREFTFAAFSSRIAVFKRGSQVATWSAHSAKVASLLVLGDYVLSMDMERNICVWSFKTMGESESFPLKHITLENGFTPTCLMHPETYINKIVVGSEEGSLQLWNISSSKKLHEFKGWGSPVTSCVPSTALDVVAVGCADGKVHLLDIRYDKELFSFSHSNRGAVTALAFRSDGQPFLACGGSSGVISIWNLESRRLQSVIRNAHDCEVISLYFFAKEPVLMSSSADNSIKVWIFDTSDGDARLLRFRSGHSAPPLSVRFYANGRHILSAGQDRAFRLFSVVQDQQSRELSQRHVSKRAKKLKIKDEEVKLNPVIAFDCAEIRERDWCNVVTCHMDSTEAYVWRLQNFVLGEHILRPCPSNPSLVKVCAISACGNFAILGTVGGWIEKFNLQSGISRGIYKDNEKTYAHDGEVVGVACDSTNTIMISAGYRGDVKVWDFKGCNLKCKWEVDCTLVKIVYNRLNGLLATVADDLIVRLFDVVAMRMVRKFEGHTDRITDLCFSEDGKWLISSSMDGTLRIWDVIFARQIDVIQVDDPVTALSLSPNMDILATTHIDRNGLYLWFNREIFSGSSNTNSFASVKLPLLDTFPAEDTDKTVNCVTESQRGFKLSFSDQQILDLITLSLLPKSQWQSLMNLDIIKERNKPIEPPKKPEKAPFFLPSVPSLSGDIVFNPVDLVSKIDDEKAGEESKSKQTSNSSSSQFLQLLHSTSENKNYSAFTDYVKSLSPSILDMELRMLQIVDEVEHIEERTEFHSIYILHEYFIYELSSGNNFEFLQAFIHLFLKIHGETIRCQPKLREKAAKLLETQSTIWARMDKMFQSTRCMVTFLSNSQF